MITTRFPGVPDLTVVRPRTGCDKAAVASALCSKKSRRLILLCMQPPIRQVCATRTRNSANAGPGYSIPPLRGGFGFVARFRGLHPRLHSTPSGWVWVCCAIPGVAPPAPFHPFGVGLGLLHDSGGCTPGSIPPLRGGFGFVARFRGLHPRLHSTPSGWVWVCCTIPGVAPPAPFHPFGVGLGLLHDSGGCTP